MDLKEFKIVKNRSRPDLCYSFNKNIDGIKYSIFTQDGGKTFLASVEKIRLDGRWYSEFSSTYNSIDECLNVFEKLTLN